MMDNNKKLSEELLKIDGIDPTNITDTEREMFKTMLDKGMKHHNKLTWISIGSVFFLNLIIFGLGMSERMLDKLHIPFVVPVIILIAGACAAFFLLLPKHNKQLQESGRKVQKLHFLVHGKHKGLPLVGKKNGKRCINWPNVLIFSFAVCLIVFISAFGYHYLLGSLGIGSIQTTIPVETIIKLTISIFIVMALVLSQGLKAQLEDLEEIQTNKRKFYLIIIIVILAASIIVIYFLYRHFFPQ